MEQLSQGEGKQPTISQAMAYLALIEQRIHQEGAVDTEPNSLREIREALHTGKATPEQAISLGNSLLEGRQSYH